MDDQRTQQTLDALADLFLTQTLPPRPPRSTPPPPRPAPPPAVKPPTNPALAEALDGPAPLRLPPKASAATGAAGSSASPRADAGPRRWRDLPSNPDASWSTIEGPTAASASPASAPAPLADAPPVQAVILGHLPGFGSPWLTQYANFLAQRRGPVMILHLDGSLSLELIDPNPIVDSDEPDEPLSATQDLFDALNELALDPEPMRHWLLHMGDTASPQAQQRLRELSHWTLITGADDAAVVGAYRLLKQLVESAPAGAPQPHVSVMIMGSDEPRSRQAAQRLSAAAANFLKTPIDLAGWCKQMAPVNSVDVGTYDESPDLWPRLREFLDEQARQLADAPATPPARERPTPAAPPPVSQPQPVAKAPSTPPTPPAPEPAKSAPVPQSEPAQAPTAELELSAYLTGVGGLALQARCPRQPQTQLVLDQQGQLHLLRRHVSTSSSIREAIVDLIEARAWVREHLELLQLTQRQCRFDAAAEPVLHLFTDDAKTAAALSARLEGQLKLHFLQQVRVGESSTCICTELN